MNIKNQLARLEVLATRQAQREAEERKEIELRLVPRFMQASSISEAEARIRLDRYPLAWLNGTATVEERTNFAVNSLRCAARRRFGVKLTYKEALQSYEEFVLKSPADSSPDITMVYLTELHRSTEE